MSDNNTHERDEPRHETAAGFRLRPERRRVMRLSRKALAGLAGVASLAILGSLIWALDSSRRGAQGGQQLFNTDNKTTPDNLAALPKDYIGLPQKVPQFGPPLPGDLGRPILNAHSAGPAASGFETTEQRMAQESEAARSSRLFSTTRRIAHRRRLLGPYATRDTRGDRLRCSHCRHSDRISVVGSDRPRSDHARLGASG